LIEWTMLVDYGHSTQHAAAAARVLWIDDGARCWENAFQAFGSAKLFWGRTQTPRMGFATSVLAGSGSTRHGLAPQAKNPSYGPATVWVFLQNG